MNTDPRLERYLHSLDQVLKPFPVGDRAEIVLEIKSHVLAALERDAGANLDQVLAALGEPETVANRYLMERGLKPAKPPISPIVKWLINGVVVSFALFLAFLTFVMVKFTPLIDIDGKSGRVSMLGGLIHIQGEPESADSDSDPREEADASAPRAEDLEKTVQGSVAASPKQEVFVQFGNAKIDVLNAADSQFSWSCSGASPGRIADPIVTAKSIRLDLGATPWALCRVSLPQGGRIRLEGSNGKIDFDHPRFAVSASVTNGVIEFAPASDRAYRYDVKVTTGEADAFQSSKDRDAIPVNLRVMNGKIGREDGSSQ